MAVITESASLKLTFQYDQEPEFEEDEIVAISMKRLKELLEAKHDSDLFGKVK